MDSRIDIIVLGATGFTGHHVVKNLALLNSEPEYCDITWGISGRSKNKLQNLLTEIQKWGTDASKIPVIECDIGNESSITNVTRRAQVILNATGPNTLLSEPVVQACMETGTHYLDISAELHHILNIFHKYHEEAEKRNVLIMSACGFASIPVTTGLMYLEKNFKGMLHSVECYTDLGIPRRAHLPGRNKCLLHYGTYESMFHVMQTFQKQLELTKQIFADRQPVPEEIKKSFFHRHDGQTWVPYPGPDQDVVKLTQHIDKKQEKKPYHFKIYLTMPILFFVAVPLIFLCYYASHIKCLLRALLKYPRFFSLGYISHKGPTEEMRNDMKYSFTMIGKGWNDAGDKKSPPNKTIKVKVSGSDPGYKTTAISLIFSAITILKEGSRVPKGGVLTAGSALSDTKLLDRLSSHGMNYEIMDNF